MRVSTDPTDPAYIDERPRKAWCNDVLIEGWTVADEFRRCVITPAKVHQGSVLIERLPSIEPEPVEAAPVVVLDPAIEIASESVSAWIEPEPEPVAEAVPEPVHVDRYEPIETASSRRGFFNRS